MSGKGHRGRLVGAIAASSTVLILAAPASADTRTVYMTTSDSCTYDCAVAVMQVKDNKIGFKMSPAQANGISSIGWISRRGDTVRGLVGGSECSTPTKQTRQVSGRGSRTHFVDMKVTSKAQARAFANRHSDLGVGIPDWPWGSLKRWKANYAEFCE